MDDLPDYSTKRFMVVDDEPFMLGLIDRMLRQCGNPKVVRAIDGKSALVAFKDGSSRVDCIISDCNMKPVNGLQLLQAIRAGINPHIPRDQAFIMLTGHGDTEVVKSALALDVSGYLVKPVSPDKLMKALERALQKPVQAKDPQHYRAQKLAELYVLDDNLDGSARDKMKGSAWVVLSRTNSKRNDANLKAKLASLKVDAGTDEGKAEVKMKNLRKCILVELKEGMILAEDVLADEEHVLLKRGTQMDASLIEKLRELAVESELRDYVMIGDLVQ